jgi:four helix bundle protein
MHNYKKLNVWIKSMSLVDAIYDAVKLIPEREVYGFTSQLTRSAISIPSNIAEGCGRNNKKEFRQFLGIALGSAYELETQVLIGFRRNWFSENEKKILLEVIDIQKMLQALIKTLS